MLSDGRQDLTKHPDLKSGIAGGLIFNPVIVLIKLKVYIFHRIILICESYPFFHAVDETGPESILIGAADMQIGHIRIQIRLPLGVIGIRVDPGADIIQLHLCRIPDIDAVDRDGREQQQKGENHVDCEDDENSKEGEVTALVSQKFISHQQFLLFPIMFAYSGALCNDLNGDQIEIPETSEVTFSGHGNIKWRSYLNLIG